MIKFIPPSEQHFFCFETTKGRRVLRLDMIVKVYNARGENTEISYCTKPIIDQHTGKYTTSYEGEDITLKMPPCGLYDILMDAGLLREDSRCICRGIT